MRKFWMRPAIIAPIVVVVLILFAWAVWSRAWATRYRADRDFTSVFYDDFNQSVTIPPVESSSELNWGAYSGPVADNRWARWSPKNVVVANGEMLLETTQDGDRYVTAGLANGVAQTYGRWEVRMRMPHSAAVKFKVQLWPKIGWPPQIDFAEGGGRAEGDGYAASFHWSGPDTAAPGAGTEQTSDDLKGVDMSQWHTVGVEWLPGTIRYTIDGRMWAQVQSEDVPDKPMWLSIQTEATRVAEPGTRTSPLHVDRVEIWRYTPHGEEPLKGRLLVPAVAQFGQHSPQ